MQPTELKIVQSTNSSSFTSSSGKNPQSLAPPTLRPSAADAYLLLKVNIKILKKKYILGFNFTR